MRKNVITKSKKQISLEERIAREQEKLHEMNAVMEARKQKLEARLRQLISAEFVKNLEDFADFADDELEEIIKAAMNSKDCKDKIEEYRKAVEEGGENADEGSGKKSGNRQKKGQNANKSKDAVSKDSEPIGEAEQEQAEENADLPGASVESQGEDYGQAEVQSFTDDHSWSN